jgi:arylsulfatase A-like enzyme
LSRDPLLLLEDIENSCVKIVRFTEGLGRDAVLFVNPLTARLLKVTLATLLLAACQAPSPDLGPPPNVLLLVVDCLRADRLSVNGYERATTPHVDALAAESVRFTRAISQASWTRPSLPTILTGLYPSEHGLHNFDESEDEVKSVRLSEEVTTLAEALKGAGYRTALIGEQFQLSPRFGLNQGFDFYKHRASDAANIHRNFFRWLDGETGDDTAPGSRFFAYLHYLEIHWPYCPPPSTRGTFDAGGSDVRWCHDWRRLRSDILEGRIELDDGDRQALAARYDEELLALDARLGELFATLRERGLWDDTLIVLTSDHGEELYEHGSIGHGQSLYAELIDVPLVFKPPAPWPYEKGRAVDVLVELRSVTPTVLEAAGAPPAGGGAPSLVSWIAGRPPSAPPAAYVVAETPDQVVVRSDTFKLIARRDGSAFELFDLAADPGETLDLTRERRRELQRLRAALESWREGLEPVAAAASEELDPETREGLEALGYLDG